MISNAETAMKHKDLIVRYLEGLTSPEEERQLRDALEAKASLSEDERAVLEILSLSYPGEDTAALLAEDLGADFDAMTAKRIESPPLQGELGRASRFTWRFATVFSIAAVLLIAFLLWPESHEETTTLQVVKPVVAEANPQPIPRPIIEEKEEEVKVEVQTTQQPAKKRRKAVKKRSAPVEPVPTKAEAMKRPVEYEPIYTPTDSEPFLDDFAQIQDIRSRGERLQRMVDAMIN